jgi:hypothetical protein
MTDQNIDVDFKKTDAIRTINHIGKTTYVNIVTGKRTDVEWGAGDWLGAAAIGCLMFILFALIVGMFAVGFLLATGVIH